MAKGGVKISKITKTRATELSWGLATDIKNQGFSIYTEDTIDRVIEKIEKIEKNKTTYEASIESYKKSIGHCDTIIALIKAEVRG